VKAFDDGGCVYEISSTQDADEVRVELGDLYPGGSMHVERTEQQSCVEREGHVTTGRLRWAAGLC